MGRQWHPKPEKKFTATPAPWAPQSAAAQSAAPAATPAAGYPTATNATQSCAAAALPDGWTAHQDENNDTYYYHASSGKTQWEIPEEVKVDAPKALPAVPQGWTATRDDAGEVFYVSPTGDSQWDYPVSGLPEGWTVHTDGGDLYFWH